MITTYRGALLVRLLLALGLVLFGGCKKKPEGMEGEPGAPEPEVTKPVDDPAVAGIPYDPAKPVDRARLPRVPETRPLEVAARFILVSHAGARNAVSQRSESDARKRAQRLAEVARQQGTDFAQLAQRFSEAPEKGRGALEIVRPGDTFSDAFVEAATGLGEGQVSDPVATGFGYYVILREPLEEYSTAHILVVYSGAERAPPALKRTKVEARKRAELAAKKAAAPGANFALLASRFSDSPSSHRGGVIAPVRSGSLIAGFEPYLEAARQLEVGAVSGVVETPYGFHVIKRLPLEKILIQHIVIGFNDAQATKPRERRTKVQARDLAAKVRTEALAEGADFTELAKTYSDGPGADRGGLLPPLARGVLSSALVEQFAFALAPGQVSDVIETELGYFIVKRVR